MLYRLKHYLFGWDYVAWRLSPGYGVARVRSNPAGHAFYKAGFLGPWVRIVDPNHCIWLTCHPDKYMFLQR